MLLSFVVFLLDAAAAVDIADADTIDIAISSRNVIVACDAMLFFRWFAGVGGNGGINVWCTIFVRTFCCAVAIAVFGGVDEKPSNSDSKDLFL